MANRSTEIGRILRAGDPKLARRRVSTAIAKARGNMLAASRILRVDENTVWRWVFRLALEDYILGIREKHNRRVGTHLDSPLRPRCLPG